MDALELMRVVLSRALFFAFGFAAGFLTAILVWIAYRVLPKLDTFVSVVSSYHNFRLQEKRRIFLVWLFIIVAIVCALLGFFLAVVWVAWYV